MIHHVTDIIVEAYLGRFTSLCVSCVLFPRSNHERREKEKKSERDLVFHLDKFLCVFGQSTRNFMERMTTTRGRILCYTCISCTRTSKNIHTAFLAPVNSPLDVVLFLVLRREFSSSQHPRYTDALS